MAISEEKKKEVIDNYKREHLEEFNELKTHALELVKDFIEITIPKLKDHADAAFPLGRRNLTKIERVLEKYCYWGEDLIEHKVPLPPDLEAQIDKLATGKEE